MQKVVGANDRPENKKKSDSLKVALMVLMVGMTRFELAPPCSRSGCSNRNNPGATNAAQ